MVEKKVQKTKAQSDYLSDSKSSEDEVNPYLCMSWPENQGILFFYISKTLQMIWISFMASLLNAVL